MNASTKVRIAKVGIDKPVASKTAAARVMRGAVTVIP